MMHAMSLTFREATLAQREPLSVDDTSVRAWLRTCRALKIAEAVMVSTCNRTEFYSMGADDGAGQALQRSIATHFPAAHDLIREKGVLRSGPDAVRHLFRVTASLDSMVVGEPQIMGQMKSAYEMAQAEGSVGSHFHFLFQQAFRAAKKVRSDTGIGERPVSVGSVAVALAEQIMESLQQRRALIFGTGEMSRTVVEHLQQAGLEEVMVVSRSADRGAAFAQTCGGVVHTWDTWPQVLPDADVIVASMRVERPVLARHDLESARGSVDRPLVCIDLGVPRNVADDVRGMPACYLYDIDDLQQVAEENRQWRTGALDVAEALVATASALAWNKLKNHEEQVVAQLHQKCESIRRHEVARSLKGCTHPHDEVAPILEQCTKTIIAKILHDPTLAVRDATHADEGTEIAPQFSPASHWLRRLFRLDTNI
jgi:glutamyl-tRNA reductase